MNQEPADFFKDSGNINGLRALFEMTKGTEFCNLKMNTDLSKTILLFGLTS